MQRFAVWFQQHIRNGTLSPALDLALLPFAFAYGIAGRFRSGLYEFGLLKTRSLSCPVISVGNLTVGGTGKTPVVIALANWLHSQGKRVGVISRGYGRDNGRQIVLVSDGQQTLVDSHKGGDEPVLIATRCPGVPVIVGADRYAAGTQLLRRFSCNVLILDDGFQHLALQRDADLLLVDAESRFGNGCLLPRGPLREPSTSIKRATALMVTRASSTENNVIASLGASSLGEMPIGISRFALTGFVNLRTGDVLAPEMMRGKRCIAFCGIANPNSFSTMLENAGLTIQELLSFPDHWRYTSEDLQKIWDSTEGCAPKMMVTTEKDAVKIRHRLAQSLDVFATRIELEWVKGQQLIEQHLMDAVDRG
ncbi:MAG TPA: tetraacyldisaccharide 4'-kinase [Nitrospirales bacterium]|nr:tetraacyldisaccharide 4'-kinase [Nitrospirales bacterium]HIC05115.1 tetraacyldisaccharide 4'-kinase [Nitrospirales bacterium]HIO20901.1 tetraacyldisaccharide 4'-kinase [Nitrospirales bacterium]HIO69473.1 tetraacyldisaccharide 4'-kinase [Nitrospirales bacterium]